MDKKKILVVIDAQNDLIDGSIGTKEAQAAIPNVLNKIKTFIGDAIFVTRDTHQKDYLDTHEGHCMNIPHCIYSTQGWALQTDIQNALNLYEGNGGTVKYINKPTFGSPELSSQLSEFVQNNDVDIEIVGFNTDRGVISSALIVNSVMFERANITVDANCCAGTQPSTHIAALQTMQVCQINVTNFEG